MPPLGAEGEALGCGVVSAGRDGAVAAVAGAGGVLSGAAAVLPACSAAALLDVLLGAVLAAAELAAAEADGVSAALPVGAMLFAGTALLVAGVLGTAPVGATALPTALPTFESFVWPVVLALPFGEEGVLAALPAFGFSASLSLDTAFSLFASSAELADFSGGDAAVSAVSSSVRAAVLTVALGGISSGPRPEKT